MMSAALQLPVEHQDRAAIEQTRQQLLDNGYQPVAVKGPEEGGKAAVGGSWPTAKGMPKWRADATNTGINCRGLRAIDVDVDDPIAAGGIIKLIQDRLGSAPVRTRSNSGRCLLLYRAAEGEPGKCKKALGGRAAVEVLGAKQQFVAYGIHVSGAELEWLDSSPLDTPFEELTAVTEGQVEALLAEIFERFATAGAEVREADKPPLEPRPPLTLVRDGTRDRAWAVKRLQGEMQELAKTVECRNDRLHLAVFRCAQLVPHGLLSESEIEAPAIEACHKNGLATDKESGGMTGVRKTIISGMKAGREHPYDMRKVEARRRSPDPRRATSAQELVLTGGEMVLNTYSLENPDRWVPVLCPDAACQEDGGYEVVDADGVVVTVTRKGISGSILPIDLVAEQLGMPREDAAQELAKAVGFKLLGSQSATRNVEAGTDTSGRTVIECYADNFTEQAEKAEKAIAARHKDILEFGGKVVRPVISEARGAGDKPVKAVKLTEVTIPYMRQLMDGVAKFMKPATKKKPQVALPVPRDVAELILNRAGHRPFPEVVGVIACPTLRPDGSLLADQGYDPVTRLYLVSDVVLPPIPSTPTRAEAEASLARLKALLGEFPFVGEGSLSVALSVLISSVARGMLPHAPIHAVTAPTAGTGKSFLLDLASILATGFACAAQSVGRNDEEAEKRLVGSILAGSPIICLDNINGVFGSDFLCQVVTQSRLELRPLGSSAKVTVEPRSMIFANGNNMALTGDLLRRTIVARLDTGLEDPHKRRFDSNPAALIMADRGRYIADCLTIVLAYMAAGQPGQLRRLASFDAWSDNVRSALVWLGCDDPCETMERARDDDPEAAKATAFFEAWGAELGTDSEYKVADIVKAIEPRIDIGDCPMLREAVIAIADQRGIDPKRLGMWLDRHRDRIISGLQLSHGQKTGGSRRWLMRRTRSGA